MINYNFVMFDRFIGTVVGPRKSQSRVALHKVNFFQEENMYKYLSFLLWLIFLVDASADYLEKIYCKDHENFDEHDSCGPTINHDR